MTRLFPQLASGAMTQFPLRVRERYRTVVNQTRDGRRTRYYDAGASELEWELSHAALSSDEWSAIETLFNDCEGRRRSFLFLDPWSNLVAASESFADSVWTRGPGLGLTEGRPGPFLGVRATQVSNTAGTLQSLAQSIAIPAWFRYSLSVYARASTATQIRLFVSTDGTLAEQLYEVSSEWQRYYLLSGLTSPNEEIEVGVQLPGSASIDLFGVQLEAQLAPSQYQRTTVRTGRYPAARFATDTLTQSSTSLDEHSAVIRIVTRVANDV